MESQRNNIALYAAIKTFHADGNDIWATVSALTLLTIDETATIEVIKKSFSDFYEIDIPTETLRTVLARLKKDGSIESVKLTFSLTEDGELRKASLDNSVKDVRKDYQSLHENFTNYLSDEKITGITNVEIALLNFIDDNIGFTSELIAVDSSKKTRVVPASSVAKYILHIAEHEPRLFEIFQNIFFGRLYLTLMKTRTELDSKAKFEKLTVLLDTNVMLSLLGLHDQSSETTAHELLDILLSYKENINVGVLDITIDESISVIHAHSQDKTEYVKHMKVDTEGFRLKLRNINKTDLALLIENFEEKVSGMGILILETKFVDQLKYEDTYSQISKLSQEIEQEKTPPALKHDALAIENVRLQRKGVRTTLLEKCKMIFVTQDRSLIAYAKQVSNINHQFLLAIRPVDIMSLLWVKSLGKNDHQVTGAFLRHAVMGYARERLIDNALWKDFVQKMEEALNKGAISDSDINFIMASEETERLLSTNDKKVVKSIINQDYIDKLRDEHKNLVSANIINNKKIKQLGTQLNETKEHSSQAETKNEGIIERLRIFSTKISNVLTIILGILVTAISSYVIYYLLTKLGLNDFIGWIAVGIYILSIGAATVFGKELKIIKSVLKLRNAISNNIALVIYKMLYKTFVA